jgi:hypothetical protein
MENAKTYTCTENDNLITIILDEDAPIVDDCIAGFLEIQGWKMKQLACRLDRVIDHLQSSL